ncbi:hypothetical protein BDR05DRAFT_441584 [Suillus weaverae]|nr:hypothetical protein BDR05DRAFT_441584 [Suillus weaverae]
MIREIVILVLENLLDNKNILSCTMLVCLWTLLWVTINKCLLERCSLDNYMVGQWAFAILRTRWVSSINEMRGSFEEQLAGKTSTPCWLQIDKVVMCNGACNVIGAGSIRMRRSDVVLHKLV